MCRADALRTENLLGPTCRAEPERTANGKKERKGLPGRAGAKSHLEAAAFVVVRLEDSEKLRLSAHRRRRPRVGRPLRQGAACKALHLDVVELAEVTEPLDEPGGAAACELQGGRGAVGAVGGDSEVSEIVTRLLLCSSCDNRRGHVNPWRRLTCTSRKQSLSSRQLG